MADIIPLKIEYNFKVANHTMRSVVEHLELARRITFSFDDKVISERVLPPGDFLTDDDCISKLVETYCKNEMSVYADLFKNHSDKVHLISKVLDFQIENYGIKLLAHILVEKNKYTVKVSDIEEKDVFNGTFGAETFSEVLEKVRIFINTLAGISEQFSAHINELANDKVEEWIKWE